MRALVGLLTVVLSLLSFFPTAHADVIDPGIRTGDRTGLN